MIKKIPIPVVFPTITYPLLQHYYGIRIHSCGTTTKFDPNPAVILPLPIPCHSLIHISNLSGET